MEKAIQTLEWISKKATLDQLRTLIIKIDEKIEETKSTDEMEGLYEWGEMLRKLVAIRESA